MKTLGISCFYHDSAAALMIDGEIVAAAQEERFTRLKHDQSFPNHAIAYCLEEAGLTANDLDHVGFYDKPLLKFERILTTHLATWPRSYRSFIKGLPIWLKEKLWIPHVIRDELNYEGEILFAEHHISHAASAFYASPFDEAAILTVDGVGEWATATWGVGNESGIKLLHQINFPHSIGLLYSAFTYFLGFKVNSAEYKVMGLAPHGEPRYVDLILDKLIHVGEDGSFHMNLDYFTYPHGLTMTGKRFETLFGIPRREPESSLDQIHKDIATSLQRVTEEVMLRMARNVRKASGLDYLCLAGGVALNCVANGRILREGEFEDIFIQPAAGDAGGAVGVAYYIQHDIMGTPRRGGWTGPYFGPEFDDTDIKAVLDKYGIMEYRTMEQRELFEETARLIDDQNVIGWYQGRMEFGPRALGNRSIIADARNPENQDRVNLKIKFRESFRPFAPTVLEESISDWFEIDRPSPYMLFVADVRRDRRTIPSVTHVDGSARIQSVNRDTNPMYYDVIKAFEKRTGCPVIINTSFNVRGEPIVCTPQDAFLCFMRTNMDILVMGPYLLEKSNMPTLPDIGDARELFELD